MIAKFVNVAVVLIVAIVIAFGVVAWWRNPPRVVPAEAEAPWLRVERQTDLSAGSYEDDIRVAAVCDTRVGTLLYVVSSIRGNAVTAVANGCKP